MKNVITLFKQFKYITLKNKKQKYPVSWTKWNFVILSSLREVLKLMQLIQLEWIKWCDDV